MKFNEIESAIRSGNAAAARALIKEIWSTDLNRKLYSRVANLARRSGLPSYSLKLLNPIVRAKERLEFPATDQERSEYAAALLRIGSIEEAQQILEGINAENFHESLLYRAFAHFAAWDYSKSIPVLKLYLQASGLTPYQQRVAEINLTAALIAVGEYDEARTLLEELEPILRSQSLTLLHQNSLELSAQLSIMTGDYLRAERSLEEISSQPSANFFTKLFTRKWQAIMKLKKSTGGLDFSELKGVRAEALEAGHWETVRDCDLQAGILGHDERSLLGVYFGTPYQAYRDYILRLAPTLVVPDQYLISSSSTYTRVLDLWSGHEDSDAAGALRQGQLVHRCLIVLASDAYRPVTSAAMFATLFPDEYYNPHSSQNRVHHAVMRLRQWFEESNVPCDVLSTKGGYRLSMTPLLAIRHHRIEAKLPASVGDFNLVRLEKVFGTREFSAKEAARELGYSLAQTHRYLKPKVEAGKLLQMYAGPKTRYRLDEAA